MLCGNPFFYMKNWFVVGDFMGGTMTDLQMICHWAVNLLLLRITACV